MLFRSGARILTGNLPIIIEKNECCFWQNMDFRNPESYNTLINKYDIDPTVAEALCDEDTRPRFFTHDSGLAIILRGVNSTKNQEPEEMVSLRIWVEKDKIITLEHRYFKSITQIMHSFEKNKGPTNTLECFFKIIGKLNQEILTLVNDVTEKTNDLEDEVINLDALSDFELRAKLGDLRREIISIRRYLAPQRDTFLAMQAEKVSNRPLLIHIEYVLLLHHVCVQQIKR